MEIDDKPSHGGTLREIIVLLEPLDHDSRRRILRTLGTYFEVLDQPMERVQLQESMPRLALAPSSFSSRAELSPKEFLVEKAPGTDIERVACLAFYLTHYRDCPHFETADIVTLNTEAAQPRFSNAHWSVGNAVKQGYLAQASKGKKQISAGGEQFVLALPDRDAAKTAMQRLRSKRSRGSRTKRNTAVRDQPNEAGDNLNG